MSSGTKTLVIKFPILLSRESLKTAQCSIQYPKDWKSAIRMLQSEITSTISAIVNLMQIPLGHWACPDLDRISKNSVHSEKTLQNLNHFSSLGRVLKGSRILMAAALSMHSSRLWDQDHIIARISLTHSDSRYFKMLDLLVSWIPHANLISYLMPEI